MEYYQLAEIQLHKAIDLFLEEDYICAITLAGASEEVLGKLIKYSLEDKNAIDLLVEKIQETDLETSRKKIISSANNARDGLKHFNPDKEFQLQPVYDALILIFRAMGNYCLALGVKTEKMDYFARHPDVRRMLKEARSLD